MRNKIIEILLDKKQLRANNFIIVDTEKILKDLLNTGFDLKYFLYSEKGEGLIEKYNIKADTVKTKTFIIKKLSSVETDQGFVAVFEAPLNNKLDTVKEKQLILFDKIQDPTNTGAIIRSGTAFGFYSYLFLDSVYIFNNKTIRSSAGTCFMVKYKDTDIAEIKKLKENGFKLLITDKEKGKDIRELKKYLKERFILVFGNEGEGIRNEIREISDEKVNIDYPDKKVESLNVSNAASILFYEINNILNGGK
jgi:TrmH family RNA methyltransferase